MSGLQAIIEDTLSDYGVFGDNAPLAADMDDRIDGWLLSEETVQQVRDAVRREHYTIEVYETGDTRCACGQDGDQTTEHDRQDHLVRAVLEAVARGEE